MTKDGKINILVIPSDKYGCGFWRSVNPHTFLGINMQDKFNVDIIYTPPTLGNLEDFYGKYDIIHIHKKLDDNCELIHFMQKCGCMVIVDIDDSPKLDKEHPLYLSSVHDKWYIPINKSLSEANAVITTTDIFAKEIKQELNKNVFVLPNALPEGEGQFVLNKVRKTNRIRFGIVCSSSHYHDILILKDMVEKMPKEYIDKIQFQLCGFDTRGTTTFYKRIPGKSEYIVEKRDILPSESIWNKYEKIITNNYSIISEEHRKWLLEYHANEEDPFIDEAYRRFWTLDIEKYYQQYNQIDVLMAPLFENHFNSVKSNLKFVESAFAHIPVIATDFGPYSFDRIPVLSKDGEVNLRGNCFLVETRKNKKDWLKTIKWIVDNPNSIKWVGENLYNDYKDTYSAKAVCQKRANIYTKILKEKDKFKK